MRGVTKRECVLKGTGSFFVLSFLVMKQDVFAKATIIEIKNRYIKGSFASV